MPSMLQVLDDEAAAAEVHAEPADRHLALEPLAALDARRAPSAPDRDRCVSVDTTTTATITPIVTANLRP